MHLHTSHALRGIALVVAACAAFTMSLPAWAHAFPDHSSPKVGATVTTMPSYVKIWFNSEIEPVFSKLIVKNADHQKVSSGKGRVAGEKHILLEARMPSNTAAGKYTVHWSVIAHDGHHTEGHFAFTVK